MSRADGPPDLSGDEGVAWRSLLREAESRLAEAGVASPAVDAWRIVEQASGYPERAGELALALDRPAPTRGVAHFDAMLARREAGEPLQYVLGAWGFRTLDLLVDRRVLIPRPETEVVVGYALDELDRLRALAGRPVRVVDLGTGSGAIALSVAAERDGVEVWASDVSDAALDVASANLAGLGRRGARVRLVPGSWFEALPDELRGEIDLVVSNPPYVSEADDLPVEVAAWEPPPALVSGPTGLEALEHIVEHAGEWLRRPGALVLELAPPQATAVEDLARRHGFSAVRTGPDLAGRPRALVARFDPT